MKHFVSITVYSLAASLLAAEPSSIKTKDGRVVAGEILGRLVLAEAPEVVVIYGKDITGIDELGVHVRPDAMLIFGGMGRLSNAEAYKNTTALEVLKAVMPIAAKDKGQDQPDKVTVLRLRLSGQGDGSGFGTTAVGGGRVYFYKSVYSDPLKQPVVGELIERGGVISLGPTFTVVTETGRVSVPVESLFCCNPLR